MKQIIWTGFLITVLALSSCGGSGGANSRQSGTELSPEFFSGAIEGEITVSAYDTMAYRSFLEEAARAFEALYPGTKVNAETFSAMPEVRSGGSGNNQMTLVQMQDDPQGRADYISRVNTNIMSGSGADVYAMDVLPLHKFVEGGTLENLDRYMEMDPDFNKNDYRQNILDAVRYKNGTWFIPLDYNFSYFAYDSTLVSPDIAANFGADKSWNTEQLFNIGMSLFDGNHKLFNMTGFTGRGAMFYQLLSENIESFINLESKSANFTNGSFASLLNSVNYYTEQGYIPQGVNAQMDAGRIMQRGAEELSDRFFFKRYLNANLLSMFTRDLGMIMRMAEGSSGMGIDRDDEIAGIQANADGSVPFTFSQGFAINSQSKNKRLAWEFMKFLVSREMQLTTSIMGMGFPINNEARTERAELTFLNIFARQGGILNDQQREALARYNETVEILSDSINYFVIQDTSLNDMITQELRYFADGTRNADEVARVLQNKADLYLNE